MTKAIKINLSQLNKTDRAQLSQDLKAYLSNKQFATEQRSTNSRSETREKALAK